MAGDEQISKGNEFQMRGAAEQKELDGAGWSRDKIDGAGWSSASQRSKGNKPVDDNECEKILRICIEDFICYGGSYERILL